MPLPMVHLSVAKNIAEMGFSLGDLSQFYLGSISPDAIHMRSNADKFAKRKTHLTPIGQRRQDVNEIDIVKFLPDFIKANQNKSDVSFLWGYCLHVLTDVYWINRVGPIYVENYRKDPSPIQEMQESYYNDAKILDQVLFNESIWKDDVWQYLQAVKGSDFLDLLTAQEINLWKERTLYGYDHDGSLLISPIRYITKMDLENFISEYSETIRNDLSFVIRELENL